MKIRKETDVENAFTVEKIVTIYHLKLPSWVGDRQNTSSIVSYDFWQIIYLDSGIYECCIDDKIFRMTPGCLLFCEPLKDRITLRVKDAVVGIVSFRCGSDKMEALKNRLYNLSDEERSVFSKIITTGVKIFKSIPDEENFFGQQPETGTENHKLQMIKNNLELLLIDLYEHTDNASKSKLSPQNQINYYERRFNAIKDYLKSHINENITVEELSERMGFSVSTIKRICSRHAGCGAVSLFMNIKIDEAKRLIRETDMNMTQIASSLGFSSIHYFSRTFKKRAGMSPREYAKSVLKS